jgi:tetratricopeptide (TPR) repeat protein
MKHSSAALLGAALSLSAFLSSVALSQQRPDVGDQPHAAPQTGQTVVARGEEQITTPAQLRIAAAKLQIQANPQKAQAYNELALAFVRRARETANTDYFRDAEEALAKGMALAPNDFQLEKTHVALLLGRQQFAEAKNEATALNKRTPDDVTTYGYIAEADIALGDYEDAESSAQWMLNLLPYNVPGLLIAAELREIYGDSEGALECLDRASTETSPSEIEELAWIANQMAAIRTASGNPEGALQALDQAEQIFPKYRYTIENRARAKLAQGKSLEAISLLRQLPQTPDVLYQLAKAESAAGHSQESDLAYASFENAAKAMIAAPANANRQLILYYAYLAASRADVAPHALEFAQREINLRHDVWTLDAYAWALYGNGKYSEADLQIQKALAVGVRSDQIFDHAGHIAIKLNKQTEAAKYFQAALQLNASAEYAKDARRELAELSAAPIPQPVVDPLPAASSPAASSNLPDVVVPLPLEANVTDTDFSPVPASLLTPRLTETDRTIRQLQSRVALNPKDPQGYARLGAAFLQRARETGDVEDFQMAGQSLDRAIEMVSGDLSATAPLAVMAEVCMGEHRFGDALTYAEKALAPGSGDLSPFAIVGDAYADMGEYQKSGVAYSRLSSDPRSQARTTYVRDSRLAYLKFISGDTDSAIRLMQSAVAAGVEARLPSENRAWLNYELGEFYFQKGNAAAANHAYLSALTEHPGDYRALAGLAKVRANQGKYQDAILLYQKAIAVVPMPIYVAELGDVYTKAGNTSEAEKQYQLVEYIGMLGHINQVLHNRDLALFYADHDQKLSESLALAHKEFEVRHDIYTWDALAWALYKNGKYQDAQDAVDNALRFGTKDSLLLFHAGMIEAKLGRAGQARESLNLALQINPHFHVLYADQARQQLTSMDKQPLQASGGTEIHVQ